MTIDYNNDFLESSLSL